MKEKLITLSIVAALSCSQALAQEKIKLPGEPPKLPDHPEQIDKTHPHGADQLSVPDELKQHKEQFQEIKKETNTSGAEISVNGEGELLEDENVSKKWRQYMKEGIEKFKEKDWGAAASRFKRALSAAKKEDNGEKLKAFTKRLLGAAYVAREKYMDGRDYLKEAREIYQKLGITNDGINPLLEKISKVYKELDYKKFGEKVSKYFKDAKVQQIIVYKEPDVTKFKVVLEDKFIREVKTKKVKKVKFNKIVSFEFKKLGNEKYGLENVKGVQAKTKKLWVNLLSSVMGLNQFNKPEAQVTGGKLGKEKTVVVKIPEDIYNQSKSILEELKLAINSSKYDAALVPPAEAKSDDSNSEDSEDNQSKASSKHPLKDPKDKLRGEPKPPPEVIHTLEKPVHPDNLHPAKEYNEVIDNHLQEDKPAVRTR